MDSGIGQLNFNCLELVEFFIYRQVQTFLEYWSIC